MESARNLWFSSKKVSDSSGMAEESRRLDSAKSMLDEKLVCVCVCVSMRELPSVGEEGERPSEQDEVM